MFKSTSTITYYTKTNMLAHKHIRTNITWKLRFTKPCVFSLFSFWTEPDQLCDEMTIRLKATESKLLTPSLENLRTQIKPIFSSVFRSRPKNRLKGGDVGIAKSSLSFSKQRFHHPTIIAYFTRLSQSTPFEIGFNDVLVTSGYNLVAR